jgi:hypothetical protein
MTGKNVLFIDALVGEKPIRRLGVRPILTSHGDALAHRVTDLPEDVSKSSAQPNVRELASRNLTINPAANLGAATAAPLSQYHDAPSKVIRVLQNESQPIHPIQEVAKSASPARRPKYG